MINFNSYLMIMKDAESAAKPFEQVITMNRSNSALATRQEALAAAHRLSSLVHLTQHDQFLHETVKSASDVIARAGLLPDARHTRTVARCQGAKRHLQ